MAMPVRLVLAIAVAALVAGCSSDSAKKENIEPPTPLVDFEAKVQIDKMWSTSVGDGSGVTGAGLVPAVSGGRAFFASIDGDIEAYDSLSGRRLWAKNLESFSGGPGANETLVVAGTIDGSVLAPLVAEQGPIWIDLVKGLNLEPQ